MATPPAQIVILREQIETVAAIAGVVGGADAATAVRVGYSSATAFNFMPPELGIKEGYFAKNGLDVQVIGLPKYGVPRCPHHV